jgi:hypothetical protein
MSSSIAQNFPHSRPAIVVMPGSQAYTFEQMLRDYKIPSLKLRKQIWTAFPVALTAIPSQDETQRYAVRWHENNLRAWRAERATSWAEHYNYKEFCKARLLYALAAHPKQYRIELPQSDADICVIAMVHK